MLFQVVLNTNINITSQRNKQKKKKGVSVTIYTDPKPKLTAQGKHIKKGSLREPQGPHWQ